MKTLFMPVKSRLKLDKSKILEISKKLPKNIAIAYSIQYLDLAKEINHFLSKKHKIIGFTQVLGCSRPDFPKNTQAILLIGEGRFHAISLAYETELPVYIYRSQLERVLPKDIEILKNRQKAAYMRFLNAKEVGVLISTKPGQENLNKAREFKNKLKNKVSYLFITNNIDTNEFENFGLDSWVNTACPRLDMNASSIINVNQVK